MFKRDGLIKNNIMKVYPLGESEVSVIDIQKFAMYYLDLVLVGVTNRGKIHVSDTLKNSIIKSKQIIASL